MNMYRLMMWMVLEKNGRTGSIFLYRVYLFTVSSWLPYVFVIKFVSETADIFLGVMTTRSLHIIFGWCFGKDESLSRPLI